MDWVVIIGICTVMITAMYWVTRKSNVSYFYVSSGVIFAVCWMEIMQAAIGEKNFSEMLMIDHKMPAWLSIPLYSLIAALTLLSVYGKSGRDNKKDPHP